VYVEKYDNGQKKIEAHYKSGKLEGGWREWFENGEEKKMGFYSDGKFHKFKNVWEESF
jgi:antitoxin component YwqK of YwqJK toxin-antitoxin module